MNTNEVLSAFNDAVTAYHRVPELERELKTVTEDRDFTKLELEEARHTIEFLKTSLDKLEAANADAQSNITTLKETICDLESRNGILNDSLTDALITIRNANQTILEKDQLIDLKSAQIASLETTLHDSRSLTQRLRLTIESIGRKVVAACEEPEVSSTEPFPVSNPVAMPVSSDAEGVSESVQPSNELMVEPTGTNLEPVNAPGCYTAPTNHLVEVTEKLWWER